MQNVVASIILIVLGIFLTLKPDVAWRYGEGWKNKTVTEPSDMYLIVIRIVGVIIIVGGILAWIIP